jgi:hypothetical protein
LEELNSVRIASVAEVPPGHNNNTPVMIHCCEGERTGLTLVSDLLLYTLDHNQVKKSLREKLRESYGNLREMRESYGNLREMRESYGNLRENEKIV